MSAHRSAGTKTGAVVALACTLLFGRAAAAQPSSESGPDTPAQPMPATAAIEPATANTGRLGFTGGLDVSSAYFFRGLFQEEDDLIAWPAFDVGVTLAEGDGAVRKVSVNLGLWNSLHSGVSGSSGPANAVWYESDFYTSVSIAFARGVTFTPMYTAYTSPNNRFGTVKELAMKLAYSDAEALGRFALSPYALVAFELDGNADGGADSGTYLELGVAPGRPVAGGRASLTFPVKLGLSLSDYYEGPSTEDTLGYVSAGVAGSVPLTFIGTRYGTWSLRGGVDVLALGANPKALHGGDGSAVVAQVGVGLSY